MKKKKSTHACTGAHTHLKLAGSASPSERIMKRTLGLNDPEPTLESERVLERGNRPLQAPVRPSLCHTGCVRVPLLAPFLCSLLPPLPSLGPKEHEDNNAQATPNMNTHGRIVLHTYTHPYTHTSTKKPPTA